MGLCLHFATWVAWLQASFLASPSFKYLISKLEKLIPAWQGHQNEHTQSCSYLPLEIITRINQHSTFDCLLCTNPDNGACGRI
jgi:hypothetical protein